LIQFLTLVYCQAISIGGQTLNIGMDKKEALDLMHNFLEPYNLKTEKENFWLKNNDQIVGAMGFEDERLSYVTTNWDDKIDYLNSIEMFNTLYKVLKSTFGTQYDGDIILELEEINEPSLQKFGISIHSQDGRSVRIKRENISLEIKQIAQKL
jgi:hypothetical protein